MPATVVRLLDRFLGELGLRGTLRLTYPDGETRDYGDGDIQRVHIRVHSWNALWRIALAPDPGVAEAYMDGELTLEEGDVAGLLKIAYSGHSAFPGQQRHVILPADKIRYLMRRLHQFNPKWRSRENVQHHYDLSRELYDLFLDADRQYSCAYFPHPGISLEDAQSAKKHHIAAKLLLEPGMRVLDIGSGWGGLGLTLARDYGVRVNGVTLSDEQLALSRERARKSGLAAMAEFDLMDYRDAEGPFDRIVSVGMFEHVGVNHYGEYFRKAHSLLEKDGVMLLHTIGRTGPPDSTSPFIRKYIFPGGYIPALSEVMQAVELSGLHVTDIEILTDHYADTLLHWRRRFMARRKKAVELYDERFARMWEFYLAASEAAFRYQDLVVFQIQIARDKLSIPRTRHYITDADRQKAWQNNASKATG